LERNLLPLSAEITRRFQPKSGAGLLRFLQISEETVAGASGIDGCAPKAAIYQKT